MSKLTQYKIIFIALLFFSIPSISTYCQSSTTVSKNCGKCGRSVSQYAKAGDKCPYCGVTWGKENTSKSTTKSDYPISNQTPTYGKMLYGNDEPINDDSKATKAETEAWILEKFKRYTGEFSHSFRNSSDGRNMLEAYSSYTYKDYKFIFDKYNFIIDYLDESSSGSSVRDKVYIPIYDIDSISGFSNERLAIQTKNITIKKHSSGDIRANKFYSLNFKYNSETDLDKRINKAFLHLKRFYKKEVSSEAF